WGPPLGEVAGLRSELLVLGLRSARIRSYTLAQIDNREHPGVTIVFLDLLGEPVQLLLEVVAEGKDRRSGCQPARPQSAHCAPDSLGNLQVRTSHLGAYRGHPQRMLQFCSA